MNIPMHNIKPDMRAIVNNFRAGNLPHGQQTELSSQRGQEAIAHTDDFIAKTRDFDASPGDQDPAPGRFHNVQKQEVSMTDAGVYQTTIEDGSVGENFAETEQTIKGDDYESWQFSYGERTQDGGRRYCNVRGSGIQFSAEAFEVGPDGTGTLVFVSPVRARGL